jgi:DNA-binding protein H-NS
VSRYTELKEQHEKLTLELQAAFEEEKKQAIDEIKAMIDTYSITAYDLEIEVKAKKLPPGKKTHSTFAVKKPRITVPPLYRDPESGKTWSGRGREPLWLEGKRDEFLIKQQEQPA